MSNRPECLILRISLRPPIGDRAVILLSTRILLLLVLLLRVNISHFVYVVGCGIKLCQVLVIGLLYLTQYKISYLYCNQKHNDYKTELFGKRIGV